MKYPTLINIPSAMRQTKPILAPHTTAASSVPTYTSGGFPRAHFYAPLGVQSARRVSQPFRSYLLGSAAERASERVTRARHRFISLIEFSPNEFARTVPSCAMGNFCAPPALELLRAPSGLTKMALATGENERVSERARGKRRNHSDTTKTTRLSGASRYSGRALPARGASLMKR